MTYQIHGAYDVKNGDILTKENFPQESNIIIIGRGERIIDESGQETPLRGARVTIKNSSLTSAIKPLTNIPAIVAEKQIISLEDGMSLTFYNRCIISFGRVI